MAADSGVTKHGFDTKQNMETGVVTDYEGNEIEQPAANVAGNLADLQRAGGLIATGTGSTLADGVEMPPGVTEEQAKQGVVESAKAGEPIHPKAEKLVNRKGDEITAAGKSSKK